MQKQRGNACRRERFIKAKAAVIEGGAVDRREDSLTKHLLRVWIPGRVWDLVELGTFQQAQLGRHLRRRRRFPSLLLTHKTSVTHGFLRRG